MGCAKFLVIFFKSSIIHHYLLKVTNFGIRSFGQDPLEVTAGGIWHGLDDLLKVTIFLCGIFLKITCA